MDPRQPQRHHILEYKQYLQQQNKSLPTINSYITIIKLFYLYCEGRKYYENIGLGLKSSRKHSHYSKLPLTAEQAFLLLDSIDTNLAIGKRDRLKLSLMLFNGLRTCEIERINICDFSTREEEAILYIQRKGKIDKREIVVLHSDTIAWFEEYIAERNFQIEDPLFISHRSKKGVERLVKQTIGRIVKLRLKSIGIENPKITAHSLRHTFGSLMVEQGVDIETIKDMMGHTDTTTTRIYVEMAQRRRLLHNSPSKQIGDLILSKCKK